MYTQLYACYTMKSGVIWLSLVSSFDWQRWLNVAKLERGTASRGHRVPKRFGSGQVRSGRVKTSDSVLYLSKVDRHEARDAELVGDFISQIKPSFRLSFKTDLQRHSSFESIILVLNPIIKRKTSRELQNRGLIRKTRWPAVVDCYFAGTRRNDGRRPPVSFVKYSRVRRDIRCRPSGWHALSSPCHSKHRRPSHRSAAKTASVRPQSVCAVSSSSVATVSRTVNRWRFDHARRLGKGERRGGGVSERANERL